MKYLLYLTAFAVILFFSSCKQCENYGYKFQILEHYGINGSSCLVTKDGKFCDVISPLHPQGDILSARVIKLNSFEKPLIEVYLTTYRGNGTYNLYTTGMFGFDKHILEVKAVDFYNDTLMFKDGILEPEYKDLNNDGFDDIRLYGYVEETDEKEGAVIDTYKCEIVLIWNPATKQYEEAPDKDIGIKRFNKRQQELYDALKKCFED